MHNFPTVASLPTRTMQWDLILLVQKLSEIMGPSCVSSSFSCMTVKGRVKCSTWRILLSGFLAGDGVRCLTGHGEGRSVLTSKYIHYTYTMPNGPTPTLPPHHNCKNSPFSSIFNFASTCCLALNRASILFRVSTSCRARSTARRFTSLSFSTSSHSRWCSASSCSFLCVCVWGGGGWGWGCMCWEGDVCVCVCVWGGGGGGGGGGCMCWEGDVSSSGRQAQ